LAKYLEFCSFIHLAAFVPFMFVMAQQSLEFVDLCKYAKYWIGSVVLA